MTKTKSSIENGYTIPKEKGHYRVYFDALVASEIYDFLVNNVANMEKALEVESLEDLSMEEAAEIEAGRMEAPGEYKKVTIKKGKGPKAADVYCESEDDDLDERIEARAETLAEDIAQKIFKYIAQNIEKMGALKFIRPFEKNGLGFDVELKKGTKIGWDKASAPRAKFMRLLNEKIQTKLNALLQPKIRVEKEDGMDFWDKYEFVVYRGIVPEKGNVENTESARVNLFILEKGKEKAITNTKQFKVKTS